MLVVSCLVVVSLPGVFGELIALMEFYLILQGNYFLRPVSYLRFWSTKSVARMLGRFHSFCQLCL